MCKLVLISSATKRDYNNLNDLVSIHEDSVDLSGPAYDNFTVISIPNITVSEAKAAIEQFLGTGDKVSKYAVRFDFTQQDIDYFLGNGGQKVGRLVNKMVNNG